MIARQGFLKDTECTGKSPDPLYLLAGDAIYPVLLIKESGTETKPKHNT